MSPAAAVGPTFRLEVINTGTELLLGNVTNTHVGLFGRALFPLGIRIARQVTVPDGGAIRDVLVETFGRADAVLITGGLGPTTDDITRELVAEFLGLPLSEDSSVTEAIQARCLRRRFPFQERMRRQAMRPETAEILPNPNGTAPGLYIPPIDSPSLRTPHFFLLPGPPRELKPMFENHVLPRLEAIAGRRGLSECRTYRCVGIGESTVEAELGLRFEARGDVEVGYCARPNEVDLRLIASPVILDELEIEVRRVLGAYIIGTGDDILEEVVVEELTRVGATVATAESCTGGLLASRITDVPGASRVFLRGWIPYANEAKTELLGVPEELLATHGAVSAPVARALAEGARENAGSTWALATTGIAGPGGGTEAKPVGTVFIALASDHAETEVLERHFPTDRETFKRLTTQAALDLLRRRLAIQGEMSAAEDLTRTCKATHG